MTGRSSGILDSRTKLMAGPNRVDPPYRIGALRIAHTLIKPTVVDFISVPEKKAGLNGSR